MTDPLQKYRNKVLKLLTYRPRSIHEVKRRLAQAGANTQEIEAVVSDFIEHGLLDDKEFTQWLIESRLRHKYRGRYGIKAELQRLGVDRSTIKQALQQVRPEDFLQAASQLLAQKVRRWHQYPVEKQKQKAYQLLARRGFENALIWDAIDSYWNGQ